MLKTLQNSWFKVFYVSVQCGWLNQLPIKLKSKLKSSDKILLESKCERIRHFLITIFAYEGDLAAAVYKNRKIVQWEIAAADWVLRWVPPCCSKVSIIKQKGIFLQTALLNFQTTSLRLSGLRTFCLLLNPFYNHNFFRLQVESL